MVKLKAAGELLGAATARVLGAVSVSADWITYHFDGAHTGYDAGPRAVTSFSSNWSTRVDGLVMAEPLSFGGTAPFTTGPMFLEAEIIKEHSYWFTQVASVSVSVS